jgi:hypothetical protein
MRPLCLAVAAALVCLNSAAASAQHRQWGGKAGVTVASPHYETPAENPGYGNRVSASGGGFFVQPLAGMLALQLEGLYVSKGGEVAQKDTLDTTLTLMLDYVEVPALARVTFVRSTSHSVYVFGGPAPGFRVSAKHRTSVGRPIRQGETVDIHSDVELFEFSVLAGAGVDIGSHGVVDARYEWGLTNVVKGVADEDGVRNRAFSVLVGLRF